MNVRGLCKTGIAFEASRSPRRAVARALNGRFQEVTLTPKWFGSRSAYAVTRQLAQAYFVFANQLPPGANVVSTAEMRSATTNGGNDYGTLSEV